MAAKLAGGGGSKFNIEQNSEINVTPFVDVMLVLLIIFMVAAPLATVSIHVDLPPAYVPHATPNPPKPVYITLQANGNSFIGDSPTDLASIGDDLRKLIGKRDPTKERIFIRGDSEAMYKDFMGIMNALQDNGFYSVALLGMDNNRPGAK
jgi:biopolymer transport protein ExbD